MEINEDSLHKLRHSKETNKHTHKDTYRIYL